jgi:hypothetical protein
MCERVNVICCSRKAAGGSWSSFGCELQKAHRSFDIVIKFFLPAEMFALQQPHVLFCSDSLEDRKSVFSGIIDANSTNSTICDCFGADGPEFLKELNAICAESNGNGYNEASFVQSFFAN